MDKAGADGTSVYKIDGIQGYSSKTTANSRAWSGLVIQMTKKYRTLQEATGNAEDFELNQFLKTMKDGSQQVKRLIDRNRAKNFRPNFKLKETS